MIANLSENFKNSLQEPHTVADAFAENACIHLLGSGVYKGRVPTLDSFMLPAFLMVYYRGGQAEVCRGNKGTLLRPGSFYLFRPFERYSSVVDEAAVLHFSFLQFEVTPYIQNYNLMKTALSLDEDHFEEAPYKRLGALLDELLQDDANKAGRRAKLTLLARWVAVQILSDRTDGDGAGLLRENSESRLIDSAFAYVSAHMAEPLVIADILQSSGTSKSSLERAFKNVFQLSPRQALLRFKIERSLLPLQQNLPIKTVAGELGFSSEYHFSNAFKRCMGMRPGEYRLKTAAQKSSREPGKKASACAAEQMAAEKATMTHE